MPALLGVVFFGALESATAVELEVQSNLVPIDFAGGAWTDWGAWRSIPRYTADVTGDSTPIEGNDWYYTQVAHNSDWFFLAYSNNDPFGGDRQYTYFDTDSEDATGYIGPTDTLAVGAEFFLTGASLRGADTNHIEWINWNHATDNNGNWVIMIAVNRGALMPGVNSFNFVNATSDGVGTDWAPDAGNTFPGGDWFRYEVSDPTETAFGRTWTVFEPVHRDNHLVQAAVTGAANSLSFDGIFGTAIHTAAVTAIEPEVGTKVSYDFTLTHEPRDTSGNGGLETWVAEAFGAFTSSSYDPSNAFLVSTRVGTRPFDDEASRIVLERVGEAETGSASLMDPTNTFIEHHLANGVHIEWLFTSETTIEVSVFSADGAEQLGTTMIDTISSINDIHGFRFNLFDTEQSMAVTDFTVETVALPIDGDFTGDGVVDTDDLNDPVLGWKARFGVDLDGNDFLVWQRNLGAGTPTTAAAGAIPEPSTTLLALLGILGGMPFMRRGGNVVT